MNYHLSINGEQSGPFPLEQLRARRANGELTGGELVWGQGMTDWQPLDLILLQNPAPRPAAMPPPIPAYTPKSNKSTVWIIVGSVVLFIGVMSLIAMRIAQVAKKAAINPVPLLSTAISHNSKAMAAATKPVVSNEKSVTAEQVRAKQKVFRTRQYLEGYKLRGEHNPSSDSNCVALIESWIERNYGNGKNTNYLRFADLSDSLAKDPNCTDAVALAVTAVECPELHEARNRLERALKAFETSHHKAYPYFYSVVTFTGYLDKNSPRRPVLDAKAVDLFSKALTDGSIQPDDQGDFGETLINGWANSFFTRNSTALIAAAKQAGPDYEWLARVLDGEHEINEAWRARGSGYTDSVSRNGWNEFERHLKIARSDLSSAWKLHPEWPLAPTRMMTVALGTTDITEMRLWFDRAVSAQIDYNNAWHSMRWGLRARWFGDNESLLALGVTALNTHRFDTDVPRKFFDAVTDLSQEEKLAAGVYLYSRPDIWPHLKEMYDGYIAKEQGTSMENGWRSTYIAVAYLANKYDVAREQLDAMDWKPYRGNFRNWHRDLSLLPEEVAARTDPLTKRIAEAEDRRMQNDCPGAITILAKLSAMTNANPMALKFIRDRVMSVSMDSALLGGFVHFLPQARDLTGWSVERGKFEVEHDGALKVTSDKYGYTIFSRANVGWSFEAKGEFEVVKSSSDAFQAGIVFGLPQLDTSDWYAFRIKRNADEGDVVSLSDGWTSNEVTQPVKLNPDKNTFTFHMSHWKVTATVNGQEVFHEVTLPTKNYAMPHVLMVGLGAYNDMNDTVIRYRNFEVSRVHADPESKSPVVKKRKKS